MTRLLVLGGARSGKSAHAERCVEQLVAGGKECIYIATAQPRDSEMAERIAQHQARRAQGWMTVEEPLALGEAIDRHSSPDRVLLIDCLTLWLSNVLFSEELVHPEVGPITPPERCGRERAHLLEAIEHARGDIVIVSNEVGWGVVPQSALSRWFVDEAGRLNQAVAARCDCVQLVAAGLPLTLKGAPC